MCLLVDAAEIFARQPLSYLHIVSAQWKEEKKKLFLPHDRHVALWNKLHSHWEEDKGQKEKKRK